MGKIKNIQIGDLTNKGIVTSIAYSIPMNYPIYTIEGETYGYTEPKLIKKGLGFSVLVPIGESEDRVKAIALRFDCRATKKQDKYFITANDPHKLFWFAMNLPTKLGACLCKYESNLTTTKHQ